MPPSRLSKTPFQVLQLRVAEAHWRWKVWKQVFVADPTDPDEAENRLALMRDTAPCFFEMLRDVLRQDIVLRIAKLADPEESGPSGGRRKNLSLRAAATEASQRLGGQERKELALLASDFVTRIRPFEAWRNRFFAHDDHETATGAEGLPSFTDAEVDGILDVAVKATTILDPQSHIHEFKYDGMIAHGDGESLLYVLRCGQKYIRQARLRGEPPEV